MTGATGDYSLSYVMNGIYRIEATQTGFRAAAMTGVVVGAAHTVRADIRMEVGEVQQVIEVPGVSERPPNGHRRRGYDDRRQIGQ